MAIEKRRLKTYSLGRDRRADQARGLAAKRGYGSKWRKARLDFLRKNPLCVACKERGQIAAATEVVHIVPHRGDQKLFWDRKNWQGLCKPDHSAKTGRGSRALRAASVFTLHFQGVPHRILDRVRFVTAAELSKEEQSMAKKSVHIVKNPQKGWDVKVSGSAKPVSNHPTQQKAQEAGKPIAKKNQSELVTHGRDGKIRDSDSYGNDPNPPKDKKH